MRATLEQATDMPWDDVESTCPTSTDRFRQGTSRGCSGAARVRGCSRYVCAHGDEGSVVVCTPHRVGRAVWGCWDAQVS
ncbi:hypothetical protein HEK131_29820 [Streptomyces seoulensis]|nr:hypothetical protein HEK131_29820 [Streptomyces seoulensis]